MSHLHYYRAMERSGWMRADLIGRVKRATNCPVEHVVVEGSGTEVPA